MLAGSAERRPSMRLVVPGDGSDEVPDAAPRQGLRAIRAKW